MITHKEDTFRRGLEIRLKWCFGARVSRAQIVEWVGMLSRVFEK